MTTRSDVYKIIDTERDYQISRWGMESGTRRHTPAEWLIYVQDYLMEAIHIASREPDVYANQKIMENIRKITAMGVAAMEQNNTPKRVK